MHDMINRRCLFTAVLKAQILVKSWVSTDDVTTVSWSYTEHTLFTTWYDLAGVTLRWDILTLTEIFFTP